MGHIAPSLESFLSQALGLDPAEVQIREVHVRPGEGIQDAVDRSIEEFRIEQKHDAQIAENQIPSTPAVDPAIEAQLREDMLDDLYEQACAERTAERQRLNLNEPPEEDFSRAGIARTWLKQRGAMRKIERFEHRAKVGLEREAKAKRDRLAASLAEFAPFRGVPAAEVERIADIILSVK
ncbi:hypothetical protein [Aureimonas sp. AU40]|uniref:hypothetical protein n=1 Tax=Aureimonas sp. AU40 TaxID=1637747 RepID=UPI0007867B27|nr:hypothetical protein [Aureimonas sp. AU40]